ncbi:acetylornithine transaminase [Geopsychrobacter electrodiphilus]|uniref:acetylornithine transaminase n=1 Tax=Geopsychrobacter electrodiphilus TaxID=225196 RepID=UPI000380B58E|nr:acetylornithine transaminase [Geopsychrobacter electrodiphilus]
MKQSSQSNQSQQWIARNDKVIAKTYGRYPLVPVRGAGCKLWDADGREYLDMLAGVAVNNLGHCHPRIVAAIKAQAETLIHCSNYYNIPQQIRLAELLCENSFAERVFFCNSGAEANEAAIKLARKQSLEIHGPGRSEVLTALASFHGRTYCGISATGQEKVKQGFEPLLPGFRHLPFGDIEALRSAVSAETCAIMLEPIQGEGGVNIPPAGYFQQVRNLCDEKGLLLILDEVQTGCGRSGTLFAYEQEGITPDIMTLAKGLAGGVPIGAMLAGDALAEHLGPGTHGSTFGGNPLATATGIASLETLLGEGILENCRAMGDYLCAALETLQQKYPFISAVRGRGLLIGLELSIEGGELVKTALTRGLLINCTVGKVLRFVPPLIITRTEIDQAINILDEIFSEVK